MLVQAQTISTSSSNPSALANRSSPSDRGTRSYSHHECRLLFLSPSCAQARCRGANLEKSRSSSGRSASASRPLSGCGRTSGSWTRQSASLINSESNSRSRRRPSWGRSSRVHRKVKWVRARSRPRILFARGGTQKWQTMARSQAPADAALDISRSSTECGVNSKRSHCDSRYDAPTARIANKPQSDLLANIPY